MNAILIQAKVYIWQYQLLAMDFFNLSVTKHTAIYPKFCIFFQ
jgi:hypothetical protein